MHVSADQRYKQGLLADKGEQMPREVANTIDIRCHQSHYLCLAREIILFLLHLSMAFTADVRCGGF
jgi:hypothetical protein